MISAHQPIGQYKNFTLYLRKPGFEPLPNALGKVASFIVQDKEGNTSVFAFAYSLLDAMEDTTINEIALLNKALAVIRDWIDKDKVNNRDEYPFKYQGNNFIYEPNATWWVKSR